MYLFKEIIALLKQQVYEGQRFWSERTMNDQFTVCNYIFSCRHSMRIWAGATARDIETTRTFDSFID